ncbi:MAG: DegV family protein [SAR202 cluster bacterium]|nr:DegV family protein [SAR202 cluster bacterium]
MAVRVVTDSLADLPKDIAKDYGIEVVPLYVRFGDEEFKDGVTLSSDEFYKRLTAGPHSPKTAVPAVGEFAELYSRLGQDAEGIVSIHISSKVSGTLNSAEQGAKEAKAKCPIEVVDSLQASMAIGLIALTAARAAKKGASFDEVVKLTRSAVTRAHCLTLMDTLEYLEKGGRIGKAAALLGSLLSFKPMVGLKDGEVHAFDKPRTRARGIEKLKEFLAQHSPVESYCVMHSTVPEEAQALLTELKASVKSDVPPILARYGPGLGTYIGPGGLGIGVIEKPRG